MTKDKELKKIMTEVNKEYGEGTISMGGIHEIQKAPTGIITLDKLIEGGFPVGTFSMIYGKKATGKSSFANYYTGKLQERGKKVLIIDAEHSYDRSYAQALGVDVNNLIYAEPDTVEQIGTITNEMSPYVDMIIIDSIVALSAQQEKDRKLEEDTIALIPRKLSQFFRKTVSKVSKNDCIVLIMNQIRQVLGGYVTYQSYSGGNALDHYLSLTLKFSRGNKKDFPTAKVDGKKKVIGFNIDVDVKKTKVSSTANESSMFTYYYKPEHFRIEKEIVRQAIIDGIIQQRRSWYKYKDLKVQGEDNIGKKLKEDAELFEEIKKQVLNK